MNIEVSISCTLKVEIVFAQKMWRFSQFNNWSKSYITNSSSVKSLVWAKYISYTLYSKWGIAKWYLKFYNIDCKPESVNFQNCTIPYQRRIAFSILNYFSRVFIQNGRPLKNSFIYKFFFRRNATCFYPSEIRNGVK